MKEIRHFTLLGNQGKIDSFLSSGCPSLLKTEPHLGSIIESPTVVPTHVSFKIPVNTSERSYFLKQASNWYKKHKKYGAFGDILRFSRIEIATTVMYHLDLFGHLAFPKPGLAVDLVLFLRDKGEIFVVSIVRKLPPAQGKLALVGGYRNVEKYHFQSGIEAIIAEAKQEIGITIKPNYGFVKKVSTDLDCESIPVTVKCYRRLTHKPANLLLIGNFTTSDAEKIPSLRSKRVHEIAAYGLLLDITSKKQTDLSEYFRAGDDAKEVIVRRIEKSKFFLSHHQEIFEAAKSMML